MGNTNMHLYWVLTPFIIMYRSVLWYKCIIHGIKKYVKHAVTLIRLTIQFIWQKLISFIIAESYTQLSLLLE